VVDIQWLKNCLIHVDQIATHHRYADKILGRRFNLFRLIRSGHEEVTVHSRFLGSLLDPQGLHGMGNTFLKIFIDEIVNQRCGRSFSLHDSYRINIEQSMDNGRMDLVIEGPGKRIVIENKIYAGDQENQIERYVNHIRNEVPEAENRIVMYLTLWGSEPSEQSRGTVEASEYACISYQQEIILWLEKCAIKAMTKPYVRENINQYIDLIKQLTNSPEASMQMEVKDYLRSQIASMKLEQLPLFQKGLDELQNEKAKEFLDVLESKLNENCVNCTRSHGQSFTVNAIRNESCKKTDQLQLNFENRVAIVIGYWWYKGPNYPDGIQSGIFAHVTPRTDLSKEQGDVLERRLVNLPYVRKHPKNGVEFNFKNTNTDLLRDFGWHDPQIFAAMVKEVVDSVTAAYKIIQEFYPCDTQA